MHSAYCITIAKYEDKLLIALCLQKSESANNVCTLQTCSGVYSVAMR